MTHEKRDPWERPDGITFQFVNDGIAPALDHARELGPLSNEQANPPTDIDWPSGLQAMLGETRMALVQDATEHAAQEDSRAEQTVKRWRAMRIGPRHTPPARYGLPTLLINGSEWVDR